MGQVAIKKDNENINISVTYENVSDKELSHINTTRQLVITEICMSILKDYFNTSKKHVFNEKVVNCIG